MRSRKKKIKQQAELEPTPSDEATTAHDATPPESAVESVEPTDAQEAEASAEAPDVPETIESLREKVAAIEEGILRSKADYQNLQKRTMKEKSDSIRFANADLMHSLIGVLDDFERTLAASEKEDNAASFAQGVKLVYENLAKALRDNGLEQIPAIHEPFDPHVHEALMQVATKEHAAGLVIDEIAKGYRLRDRVIRPARVVVAKSADTNESEAQAADQATSEAQSADADS